MTRSNEVCFKWGTNDEFLTLMRDYQEDHWSARDVSVLSARYPGEHFPEGMTWGLKQFGNLFCLDAIRRSESKKVLEVGPGFAHYFERHLDPSVDYWLLDEPGFYDEHVIGLANAQRTRSTFVKGLLGQPEHGLQANEFDCVFSVSVLEHIPNESIEAAAADIFRILKPGGWAAHSLDATSDDVPRAWLDAVRKAGFAIDDAVVSLGFDEKRPPGKEVFLEPMSLVHKFYNGYHENMWERGPKPITYRHGTVIFTVQKPAR